MGFFAKKAKTTGKSKKSYTDVKSNYINVDTLHKLQCKACSVTSSNLQNPYMEPSGSESPTLYVLGPSLRYQDDVNGAPFTNKSQDGEVFRELLLNIYGGLTDTKFDLYEKTVKDYTDDYFRFGNILQCHPTRNTEDFNAVECCRPRVIADIERIKPKVILGVGASVLKWLIGETDMNVWRGRKMPIQVGDHKCWFMPVYDPGYIANKRKEMEKEGKNFELEEKRTLTFDIENAIDFGLDEPEEPEILELDTVPGDFVYIDGSQTNDLHTVEDLCEYYKRRTTAYDIETSGEGKTKNRQLRPYGNGAKILSISFSDGIVHSSIALDHRQNKWSKEQLEQVHLIIADLLYYSEGKKIAHNASFELEWTGYFYGYDRFHTVELEDTLAAAYVLDQRPKGVALNVVARQYFGVDMKAYEKVDRANLDKEDLNKVLKYNVVDSVYTWYLYHKQMEVLQEEGLYEVYREQVRRIPTLVIAQLKGINVDQEKAHELHSYLENSISSVVSELNSMDDVKRFSKFYGQFNPGSEKQVGNLLGNFLGFNEVITDKGTYTTKEEVLENIDHPIVQKVLKYRESDKLRSTYIKPLLGHNNHVWQDGLAHTNYNHSALVTRRLSANFPPIQTYPSRENPWIREVYVAPKGYKFITCDLGQVESRVASILADCKLIKESLWNNWDIHMYFAERVKALYPKIMNKYKNKKDPMEDLRSDVKNQIVFPTLYSASPKSIARYLNVPDKIGYQIVEEFFELMPEIKVWQNNIREQYYKYGYIESMNGFRMNYPISYSELCNYPIQSTASDFTVNAMNKTSEKASTLDLDWLHPIVNIHDDIIWCVPDKAIDLALDYITRAMTIETVEDFPYIDVPITAEPAIGKTWYDTKKKENELGDVSSTDFGHKKVA